MKSCLLAQRASQTLPQVEGDVEVVVDDGVLADPVERGHVWGSRCGGSGKGVGWQGESGGGNRETGVEGGGI